MLRAARETVAIPAEFRRLDDYRTLDPDDAEAAFLKANRSLPADAIAVTCDKRYLREVRICMTKDLEVPLLPGDRPPRLPAGQGRHAAGAWRIGSCRMAFAGWHVRR